MSFFSEYFGQLQVQAQRLFQPAVVVPPPPAAVSTNNNTPPTPGKIDEFVPLALAGFTCLYCLLKETSAFAIGVSLAIYQKKYPNHLIEKLEKLAKEQFPYQDKKFGRFSLILDNQMATLSALALATMWAPQVAKEGALIYFTFVVTSTFLSPQTKQDTNN